MRLVPPRDPTAVDRATAGDTCRLQLTDVEDWARRAREQLDHGNPGAAAHAVDVAIEHATGARTVLLELVVWNDQP